jgi:hypothetical protein
MIRKAMVLAGVMALGLLGLDMTPRSRADDATPVTPQMVARGEYLAHAADCAACHTGTDGKLSGGRPFTTPFGTIYASNIPMTSGCPPCNAALAAVASIFIRPCLIPVIR